MINICDTGPLVAYLDRKDPHHDWAVSLMRQLAPPLVTCEPVLTEAIYFLQQDGLPAESIFAMLERGALRIDFLLSAHWPRARMLMSRYDHMDLADAAVVVMSELHTNCRVLTLDRRDFSTYRRHDRQLIDFLAP